MTRTSSGGTLPRGRGGGSLAEEVQDVARVSHHSHKLLPEALRVEVGEATAVVDADADEGKLVARDWVVPAVALALCHQTLYAVAQKGLDGLRVVRFLAT